MARGTRPVPRTGRRARRRRRRGRPLSTPWAERPALDVLLEQLGRRVGADLHIHELAPRVEEHRRRPGLPAAVGGGDPSIRVEDAWEAHRQLPHEGLGVGALVLRVETYERDFGAVAVHHLGEEGELEPAARAPGGPLVDDDRMAAQLPQALFEGGLALADDLVALLHVSGQLGWQIFGRGL